MANQPLLHNRPQKATEFGKITQTIQAIRPLRRSSSFKVTDFGTNRKLMYYVTSYWVINTNLPPILHHFQVMADYWSHFCYRHGSTPR